MSVATAALVLVVPVVAGVVVGGFPVGVVGVAVGFLVYDFVFIPPYYTLTVGAAQNWVALVVYAAVVLLVTRVVSNLRSARAEALRRGNDFRQLSQISQLLIGERPLSVLLEAVTSALMRLLDFQSVALLLSRDDSLEVVAEAGIELSEEEVQAILPKSGSTASTYWSKNFEGQGLVAISLATASGPVGLMVVKGGYPDQHERELLTTFANSAALAIAQAQLRERAVQAGLLEERDRWRRGLLGSVSHDLRTPLASIKTAVSSLRDREIVLPPSQGEELLETIEAQADHLSRLVSNLLDMTRIESGVLRPQRSLTTVEELVEEAISVLSRSQQRYLVVEEIPPDLPLVEVDHLLLTQALVNLLENGCNYTKTGSEVLVRATADSAAVTICIIDSGPGVPIQLRESVFEMFEKGPTSRGAGLGLAIARSYIELNGGSIGVRDAKEGGAEFYVRLPGIISREVE